MKRLSVILLIVLCSPILFAQTLSGIMPNQANQGDNLTLSITGSNSNFTMGSNTIWLSQGSSDIYPDLSVTVNDTLIDADFSFELFHPTGYYDLNVYNATDGLLTLNSGFLLNSSPEIISVSPNKGFQGDVMTLSISGANTNFLQGSNTVWFNQGSSTIYPDSHTANTEEEISAQFTFQNTHPTGYYDVNVNNSTDGHLILSDGFLLDIFQGISVNNHIDEGGFDVFPNPVRNGKFSITSWINAPFKIKIVDIRGSEIDYHLFKQSQEILDITLSDKSNGVYFIIIEQEDNYLIKKIILNEDD